MDDAVYKFYPPTVLDYFEEAGEHFVRLRCTFQYEALEAMGRSYSFAAEPRGEYAASIDIRTAALFAFRGFIHIAERRRTELENRRLQRTDVCLTNCVLEQRAKSRRADGFAPKILDIFADEDGLQQVEVEVVFSYATLEAMGRWNLACLQCIDAGDEEGPQYEAIAPYLQIQLALDEAAQMACQAFCTEAHLELKRLRGDNVGR